jgi:hypothetical protein
MKFEEIFDSAPLYPNLEYEIRTSSLSFNEIAQAVKVKTVTLKKKLNGDSPFMEQMVFDICNILNCKSLEYLMFSPKKRKFTNESIEVACLIISSIKQGNLDNLDINNSKAFERYSKIDRDIGQHIISALVNLGRMHLLPEMEGQPCQSQR